MVGPYMYMNVCICTSTMQMHNVTCTNLFMYTGGTIILAHNFITLMAIRNQLVLLYHVPL